MTQSVRERIRKLLLLAGVLFLFLMVAGVGEAAPRQSSNSVWTDYKQVLVLFSYDLTNYASLEKYSYVLEIFESIEGVNFSFEFFDAAKTNLDDYTSVRADVLYHKYYSLLPFDLILVFDDEALLLAEMFSNLDARSPIFYSGVEDMASVQRFEELQNEIFGFPEYLGIFETTSLAKELFPRAKRVYYLFDQSLESQFYMDEIDAHAGYYAELGLTPIFLESKDYAFSEVADMLSKFSYEDLVVFHSFNQDSNGDYLNNENVFKYFASFSTMPIFSVQMPKNGFLGGYVSNEGLEASMVAEQAIAFLQGETDAETIDAITYDYYQYVFDEHVWEDYGLDRSLMPQGSVLINQHQPGFRMPPYLFNALMLLFVMLILLAFYSQKRYSDTINKLLELENVSLAIKGFFSDMSFNLALKNTLELLNETFEAFLAVYAVHDPSTGRFVVNEVSDPMVSRISHFIEKCEMFEMPEFQQKLAMKKVFINRKNEELKFYSLEGETKRVQIKSCLFIPIEGEDGTADYIILFSIHRNFNFSKREISALNMLANILSSGILNSELEMKEAALVHSIFNKNQELEYILTHSANLIVSFGPNLEVLEMNQRAREILGIEEEQVADVRYENFVHPDDLLSVDEAGNEQVVFAGETNPTKLRFRVRTALFGYRWYEWHIYKFEEAGMTMRRVAIGHDVTKIVEREREMEFLLMHDTLTDLYNATYLKQMLSEVSPEEGVFCAYLNVSNFRKVNENFGHLVGDEFLVKFGLRLKRAFLGFEQAAVARVSGDEFAVLVVYAQREAGPIEEEIKVVLGVLNEEPIVAAGNLIAFKLAYGYAMYPELATVPEDVYRFAEAAMFECKKDPSKDYQAFDLKLYEKEMKFQEIARDVQNALAKDEFVMYYQPILNLKQRNKVHCECLLRWQHPERGLLSPGYFLDVVEKNGQIIEISRKTFVTVCEFLNAQAQAGFVIDAVSFNLSVASLRLKGEAQYFVDTMKTFGIRPDQIVIEITESLFFDNNMVVNDNLDVFRVFGVEIAIDDFGMQYSTLSMLSNVKYDVIKLDQFFTQNLGSKNTDLVVNMIHELCVYNNKRCIVEGVEEATQLKELEERGFVEFQGYYFARPMAGEVLRRFYEMKQLG